jgi:hypothetical protein
MTPTATRSSAAACATRPAATAASRPGSGRRRSRSSSPSSAARASGATGTTPRCGGWRRDRPGLEGVRHRAGCTSLQTAAAPRQPPSHRAARCAQNAQPTQNHRAFTRCMPPSLRSWPRRSATHSWPAKARRGRRRPSRRLATPNQVGCACRALALRKWPSLLAWAAEEHSTPEARPASAASELCGLQARQTRCNHSTPPRPRPAWIRSCPRGVRVPLVLVKLHLLQDLFMGRPVQPRDRRQPAGALRAGLFRCFLGAWSARAS